jgi:ketosteroid isomerase-like protein
MKVRLFVPLSLLLAFLSAATATSAQSQSTPTAPASASPNTASIPALDQIKNQQELDSAIMALDTALFDAYNRCDLDRFSSLLADDVEFYHDNGGITLGKGNLTASIKKNICPSDTHRELVPGTFEAHYMKGIGAIEIGTHRFLHPKTGGATGEARFITLWQYKDGAWKITRALSFDHHEAAK